MTTYQLTDLGVAKVEAFLKCLMELRTKYLAIGSDTVDTIDTDKLYTVSDIESDLSNFTEDGEYWNSWPITDHFNLPIVLNEDTDFTAIGQ